MAQPIEYNHKGERLELAPVGKAFNIHPFPNRPVLVEVGDVDEAAKTILVVCLKTYAQLTMSFDDWDRSEPQFVYGAETR